MEKKTLILVLILVVVLVALYFSWKPKRPKSFEELLESVKRRERIELKVAGKTSGKVDKKYTCDGDNVSPPISWGALPKGTVSLALICYDPDAPGGIFIHWVIFNIPPTLDGLPEGVPRGGKVEGVGVQGRNDFGYLGYGGPCPPSGEHRYVFLLLALSETLDLEEGVTAAQLLREAEEHVLGYGEVVLTYGR